MGEKMLTLVHYLLDKRALIVKVYDDEGRLVKEHSCTGIDLVELRAVSRVPRPLDQRIQTFIVEGKADLKCNGVKAVIEVQS